MPGLGIITDVSSAPSLKHTFLGPRQDHSARDKTQVIDSTAHRPVWLSKAALIAFTLLFTCCAVALIALHQAITTRNGIPLTVTSSEYSWTYGPTAVLVLILGLWRRVDYYFKATQPWRELLAGPAPLDTSLLLDYITPFQGTSMLRAFRQRHYPVAATILSFFLLKLIILVSTTLFVVGPTSHAATFLVEYKNVFNVTNVWHSPGYEHENFYYGGSDKSVLDYLAKLNNASTDEADWKPQQYLAMQRFATTAQTPNATSIQAPVDVFVPKITCEDATINLVDRTGYTDWYVAWESATCRFNSSTLTACQDYPCIRSQKYARAFPWSRGNCSSGVDGQLEIRYAMAFAHYHLKFPDYVSTTLILENSTAVICKIDYGVVSTNATHDLSTGRVTLSDGALSGETKPLSNLTSFDLSEMLATNIAQADDTLKDNSDDAIFTEFMRPLFQLIVAKLGNPADQNVLLQPGIFNQATTAVLEGLATTFAQESLLVNASSTSYAEGSIRETRLLTRPAALWAMMVAFFLLATICLLLVILVPSIPWLPIMSGSIAAHAALLRKSPSLLALLMDMGPYSGSKLRQNLQGMRFSMAKDPTNGVTLRVLGQHPAHIEPRSEGTSERKRPWMPLVARRPMIALTITLPILMIGLLEFLNQLSKSRNGLIYVGDTDSTVVSYVVRVTSTLAIFGIAAMFDNLDFTITAFAPWSSLRSGSAEANRSVLFNLLSVSPFFVLPQSIRRRQFGAAASNLSTLIASTLTIVVSGLWILTGPATVERSSTASLGSWDQAWLSNSKDNGEAAVKLNVVRHKGATTPPEIWNGIVLPTISLPSSNSSDRPANYTYDVRGLRPVLNCTVVPQQEVHTRPYLISQILSANVTVPAECVKKASGEFAFFNFTYEVVAGDVTWMGRTWDLTESTAGHVSRACPSLGFLFGSVQGNYSDEIDITGLVCSQGIEEVPVTVTYEGDAAWAQLSTTQRPRLASGKAWSWRHGTAGAETLGFQITENLRKNLVRFVQEGKDWANYDAFFDHLLFGPSAYNRTALAGVQNVDKLISAVTRDYTEYMTYVINLNSRGNSNSKKSNLVSAVANVSSFSLASTDTVTTEITGTRSQEITRLGIHATSKLILQVQLAIVTVLGLAGYLLVGMRDTLPRNPCNIASTMSFLAGSRLCDPKAGVLPRDAEFMNERQLDRALGRWRFSLGWWKARGDVIEEWEAMNTPIVENHSTDTVFTTGRDEYRFGVDIGRPSLRAYSDLRHD
ncbi:hypothetical protein B0T10DRAFT_548158 [Thelonectria olida]|uniref:Uncharacterized protein n=1 Tax=Thelonectria olida TaxID=1576542 RepID=A0A9P9ATB6_9HYPO|nr:hypothetical protein B0T10DRAFT_548158 [Thelonectria olida]